MPRHLKRLPQHPRLRAVNAHVGARVNLRRLMLGLSQERLGEITGVSFQQIQKYERGANRISAGALFCFAETLEVPISFFFDDMPRRGGEPAAAALPAIASDRLSLELQRWFHALPSREAKEGIVHFLRALGRAEEPVAVNGCGDDAPRRAAAGDDSCRDRARDE